MLDLSTGSENGNKRVSTPSLSKPQTRTLSPTHNLVNITHDILFCILLSHYSYLGPNTTTKPPSFHGLMQHIDDDWEDMSHADTWHDVLTNHGYNSILVRNAKWWGEWVPQSNRKMPLVRLSPLNISPNSFEPFESSPSVPTVYHPPSLNEFSLILHDEKYKQWCVDTSEYKLEYLFQLSIRSCTNSQFNNPSNSNTNTLPHSSAISLYCMSILMMSLTTSILRCVHTHKHYKRRGEIILSRVIIKMAF